MRPGVGDNRFAAVNAPAGVADGQICRAGGTFMVIAALPAAWGSNLTPVRLGLKQRDAELSDK